MRKVKAKAALLLLGGIIVLGVLTLAWAIGAGSSEAQQDAMHTCPQPGKWAISVWGGADGTDTGEALATCGAVPVAAYSLDPETGGWSYWFAAHPEPGVSNLLTLNNMQGIIALGPAAAVPASLAIPGATYTGTTSQGMPIEFEVSADGLTIRKVTYRVSGTEPEGGACESLSSSTLGPSTVGTSIVDNSFSIAYSQFDMSGHFETQSQATGVLTVHELQADNVPPCDAGPLTWTATIPSATPTAVPAGPGQMQNCPRPGKWAISVWDGPDGSETGEALAACGAGAVDFAYYLDPGTNGWLGYFEGRPEVSKLLTLENMQGIIAHGAMAAPVPTPAPTPTAVPGLASAKEAYPLAFQAAGAWRPDAYLHWADAGCGIGIIISFCGSSDYDNMASGDGRSEEWTFWFYSPATDESYPIRVAHGEVKEGSASNWGVPGVPSVLPHPVRLEEMIDSTEAVRIADDQGGSAYKAASPGNWLCGAQIDAISGPQWQIDYCPPLSQGGTGLVVWIDGGTGEVTKTQDSHWH